MTRRRVALVTCAALPDLDSDDRLVVAPLAEHSIDAVAAVWDDPGVNWSAFDLCVIRSTWDYALRRDDFVAWAHRVPRLANSADVVRWNTDKRYLVDLALAGVDVVDTRWLAPGEAWRPPSAGEWVIKPAVGAGSRDAGRYDLERLEHRQLAHEHMQRLLTAGRTVMIQPYLPSVDTYGETALIYLDGAFSHAIRKGPMLSGPDESDVGLYRPEEIIARAPTAAERRAADAALAATPHEVLLYARVDLVLGPAGRPLVMELELVEPSLFLGSAAGAPHRFAQAIAAQLAG